MAKFRHPSFCRDEHAATMVEYGLMIVLIALVVVASLYGLGAGLSNVFRNANTQVQTATEGI